MPAVSTAEKETVPYFGAWLKRHRKALGLTRSELANLVPCSPATIQKIETGLRRPSRDLALRLIECFNVPEQKQPALVEIARSSASSPVQIARMDHSLPPSNLPVPPTRLIGRENEVAAIQQMLLAEPGCLLTIIGPPGVGKTRLAMQVAANLRGEFEDGVFLVPLGSIGDSELVLPLIAKTLNLEDCGKRQVIDQVIDHLRDKEILLLVDNFEHVLNATGGLVRLLSECPLLRLLVTSRIALCVRSERQFHVQPLKLPDPNKLPEAHDLLAFSAVALFVERARAIQPAFTLNEDNAADVASICHRLDGLPLAIELIAANLRILTPGMLLDSLFNGGLLDSGELLDLEARQRTLRSTLDWSYHLLTPVEQVLLERLAVFSGGWTLEAARMVCATGQESDPADDEVRPAQIPSHLRSLVDKSLVALHRENGSSRFTLLEVIREYLLEKFTASEKANQVQKQHAEYYLDIAENAEADIRGIKSSQTLKQLERETGNFRSALEWCLATPPALETGLRLAGALCWFWLRGGHISEGKTWLARTRDKCEAGNLSGRNILFPLAKVYTGMGRIAWDQGDYALACFYAEKSIALHRQVGDKWHLGYALQSLSDILSDMDDYQRAQEIAMESLSLAQETGDPWLEGLPYILFGELARNRGDYRQAQVHYARSLALMRQAGDERNVAFMLHNLGEVAQCQGDFAQAQVLHIEALKIHEKSRPARAVAFGLEMLAGVAGASAKPVRAARLLGAAEALRHSAGSPVEGTELQFYRGVISQVCASLDQQSFTTALLEGFAMTVEQAIAYALEE